jgi:hypothetical protein
METDFVFVEVEKLEDEPNNTEFTKTFTDSMLTPSAIFTAPLVQSSIRSLHENNGADGWSLFLQDRQELFERLMSIFVVELSPEVIRQFRIVFDPITKEFYLEKGKVKITRESIKHGGYIYPLADPFSLATGMPPDLQLGLSANEVLDCVSIMIGLVEILLEKLIMSVHTEIPNCYPTEEQN